MKQRLWMLCALLLMVQGLLKADRPEGLPDSVYVTGGNFHVQGIAIDRTRRCMYFSFTTSLVKTDLKGNVIGSVEHLTGHLGDLAIHPVTGRHRCLHLPQAGHIGGRSGRLQVLCRHFPCRSSDP